jgi:hypothetical protein
MRAARARGVRAAALAAAAFGLTASLAAPAGAAAPAAPAAPVGAAEVQWQAAALGSESEVLTGVTATAADDVWASAFAVTLTDEGGLTLAPLVRHWDGTQWRTAPLPAHSQEERVNAIDALSRGEVWAVGDTAPSDGQPRSIVARWDGTKWTSTAPPNPTGVTGSGLSGVAAVSSTDVWAVGSASTDTASLALARHWDGTRWVDTRLPAGLGDAYLTAVAAAGTADVWAVGATIAAQPAPVQTPLALHWDGRSWSRVKLPSTASRGTANLLAVTACAGKAWAVGESTTGGAVNRKPLAFELDTPAGSLESTPDEQGQLNAVTCAGDELWAVGYRYDADRHPAGYGLRLGPQGWQPLSTPDDTGATLFGLTTVGGDTVWTVGARDGKADGLPLPLAAWTAPAARAAGR